MHLYATIKKFFRVQSNILKKLIVLLNRRFCHVSPLLSPLYFLPLYFLPFTFSPLLSPPLTFSPLLSPPLLSPLTSPFTFLPFTFSPLLSLPFTFSPLLSSPFTFSPLLSPLYFLPFTFFLRFLMCLVLPIFYFIIVFVVLSWKCRGYGSLLFHAPAHVCLLEKMLKENFMGDTAKISNRCDI